MDGNKNEQCVYNTLVRLGWTGLRRGWPDFLMMNSGRVLAVEVKAHDKDKPTAEQREMHSVLNKLVRLPTIVLTPGSPIPKWIQYPTSYNSWIYNKCIEDNDVLKDEYK